MTFYSSAAGPVFDGSKAEQYRAEIARAVALTVGDPASLHLANVRGIPRATFMSCQDLRYLPPPILGRPPVDGACVSLLRPRPDAAPTGVELAFVDQLGRASATAPNRVQWRFVENGCRDAWFFAGGSGNTAVVAEGFCPKPLALLAAGVSGLILGWGALGWLRHKKVPPSIKKLGIVADRRPAEGDLGADGKPLCDRHDAAYRADADHWLLELGDDNVRMTPDPSCCAVCKDSDQVLKTHDPATLLDWVGKAKPAQLSPDGWVIRLGRMADLDYEKQRKVLAEELGNIRLSVLDAMRKQGQAASGADESTVREALIAIALEHEHFVDQADDVFGIVPLAGARTIGVRVHSTPYRRWLMRTYGRQNLITLPDSRQVPSGVPAGALDEALASIAAAAADTPPRDPMLRVGWSADRRAVYWDLARAEDGAIVEIDASGWRVVDWAPVPLVYTEAAQPLPIPVKTHDRESVLAELEYLLGFKRTADEFVLLLGFMVHCLMPGGPYVLLFVTGERESGKSTRARVIKNVIDPARVPLRFRPASRDDLAISAMRQWLPVYDNVSSLPQDMSDALCVILDGGGLGKRRLYSNDEEALVEAQRAVLITAIPDVLRAGDLLSRAITVEVPILEQKVGERAMEKALELLRPRLMGLICEGVSRGLAAERNGDTETVRRADVVGFVEAALTVFGVESGAFRKAYQTNQQEAFQGATVSDPVGDAVVRLMAGQTDPWEGKAISLLKRLTADQKSLLFELPLGWPRTAHHLTGRLRRLAPDLRALGIAYERHRSDGANLRLSHIPLAAHQKAESASEASRAAEASTDTSDALNASGADLGFGRPREGYTPHPDIKPNGADPDQVVDAVLAGQRCGYCGCVPVQPVKHNDRVYCADACLQEVRARDARECASDVPPAPPSPPPPEKKSRIRRGARR
jgi:hypothetical protein